jgi:hypothetical protein
VDVARRDHIEFLVEKILSHQGLSKRSLIEFLAKRQDYTDLKNSWVPYANLRDVAKLLDYLRENNLNKLTNKQHI